MQKETTFPAKVVTVLAIAGAAALMLWFTSKISSVFVYFGIAAVISYLLDPLVRALEKRRIPRGAAIMILFGAFTTAVVAAAVILIPKLAAEARQLAMYITQQAKGVDSNTLASIVGRFTGFLHRWGVSDRHIELIKDAVTKSNIAEKAAFNMQHIGSAAISKIASSISSFISYIPGLVVIPVLVYYFLKDSAEMRSSFIAALPEHMRPGADKLLTRLNKAIGGFISGQIKLCIYIGILAWIAMGLIARLPYSLIMGFIACITEFIPYLGPILGMLMPLVVAAFIGWNKVVIVLILFGIIQLLENNVLAPRVMSSDVGMHPALIMFILMAGGEAGGIAGMLIALPLAVILKAFYEHFYIEKYVNPQT